MRICYVDEAGCTGELPTANSPIQPVLVIAGVSFDQSDLRVLTSDFLNLKKRYFPQSQITLGNPPVNQTPPFFLDWVLAELKGSNIRGRLHKGGRNLRRQAIGFLDHFIQYLQQHNASIMGRVLIKGIAVPINGRAVYTSAIQTIFSTFHAYLETVDDVGSIIIDSRRKDQNVNVAHSLFTQKFQAGGDPHERVLEMPTFGHSENHVGLQIADLICSALLFPMAAEAYCLGHVQSIHVQPDYAVLRQRYGLALQNMQHRYQDQAGKWRGGIVVNDSLTRRAGSILFT